MIADHFGLHACEYCFVIRFSKTGRYFHRDAGYRRADTLAEAKIYKTVANAKQGISYQGFALPGYVERQGEAQIVRIRIAAVGVE